jgi:purine-binding chemotaxis protein CheW
MNANQVARGERTSTSPAQSGSAREAASTTIMLLRLGTRWFGVDVRSIEEVALKGEVTRVPTAPSHILGVTTLRGRLVTVVGLEQMIGGAGMLSRETTATLPRLVVVRDGDYEMAVVAEGISGMTDYVPPTDTASDKLPSSVGFVRDEFDWHGNKVSLLDAPLLIATAAKLAGILSPSEEMEP